MNDKLVLTENLEKLLNKNCTDWKFFNVVVYLQSETRKEISEVMDKIQEENPGFTIKVYDFSSKNEKEEATVVYEKTGFTGG
jgi:hypothetical protein